MMRAGRRADHRKGRMTRGFERQVITLCRLMGSFLVAIQLGPPLSWRIVAWVLLLIVGVAGAPSLSDLLLKPFLQRPDNRRAACSLFWSPATTVAEFRKLLIFRMCAEIRLCSLFQLTYRHFDKECDFKGLNC